MHLRDKVRQLHLWVTVVLLVTVPLAQSWNARPLYSQIAMAALSAYFVLLLFRVGLDYSYAKSHPDSAEAQSQFKWILLFVIVIVVMFCLFPIMSMR